MIRSGITFVILCSLASGAAAEEMTTVPTSPAVKLDFLQQPPNYNPFAVRYRSTRVSDTLKKAYEIPFDTALRQGYAIIGRTPEYNGDESIATLDFKINNTTRTTKYATSVSFQVITSRIVEEDIPIIYDGTSRFVGGENIGWGTLSDLTASYGIASSAECKSEQLTTPVPLKTVTPKYLNNGREEVFMWPVGPSGVPERLRRQYDVCVLGKLEYKIGNQARQKLFAAIIIMQGGVAASLDPSSTYNLFLEAGRQGYTSTLPISNFMKPNEPDRFLVKFSSNKSAFFDVRVGVEFTDRSRLDLGGVELDYFRPKGIWRAPGKEITLHPTSIPQ